MRCDLVVTVAGKATVPEMQVAAELRNTHELIGHGLIVERVEEPRSPTFAAEVMTHRRGGRARWSRGGGRP